MLAVWHGGMSFHGGAARACSSRLPCSRAQRKLDLSSSSATRWPCARRSACSSAGIANFINGELWGRPTDVPWAMVFPNAGPEPRHPSQLYEAGLEGLVLFLVMLLVCATRRAGPSGAARLGGMFLIGYGLARIAWRTFREPDAQLGFLAGGLTMGQLLSMPMLAGRRSGCLVRLEPAARRPRPPALSRALRDRLAGRDPRSSGPITRRPLHGRLPARPAARLLRHAATRWARPATSSPRP